MPRTKGSKNRPKTTHTDYVSQIAEKQEAIASLNAEIASITANMNCIQIAGQSVRRLAFVPPIQLFLLYQLSLWWVKYRAQPEAISTQNHAGHHAP